MEEGEIIDLLLIQIKDFMSEQPNLHCKEDDISFSLEGIYVYCIQYKDIILQGECNIKLLIPKKYPIEAPTLFLKEVPSKMEHIYTDGSCCLASFGEIYHFLLNNPSLKEFVERFVDSFIFSLEWFKKYGDYPFGERKHGYEGLLDYYLTDWGLTEKQYWDMVIMVFNDTYRGHANCLCGSNKKMRDCHGKYILPIIKDEVFKNRFLNEACYIYEGRKR